MNASNVPFAHEKEVALRAVRSAARLCQRVQKRRIAGAALVKGDRSPVTIADFGSQAVVARMLADALPGDEVMGEEDAAELREPATKALAEEVREEVLRQFPGVALDEVLGWIDRAHGSGGTGRFWTIDPIDGTKGFLRAEQYAVALALIEGGEVKVGALACPNLPHGTQTGCVFLAVRGRGAEVHALDDAPGTAVAPARTSPIADPRAARMVESVEAAHGDHGMSGRILQVLGVAAPGVRLDSQAKYAVVARGDGDVYLRLPSSEEYRENIWDHAAGALVIEEAGGRVTDVHGRKLDFTTGRKLGKNQGVVATNGRLHDAFLAAIREVRSSPP